jgi:hypothetical protein
MQRFVTVIIGGVLLKAAFLATPAQASPLTFNVIYDASTSSAPAAFFSAFNDAIQFYETQFDDPITINIDVGWGEIDGHSLSPGDLGNSQTNQQGFYSYSQIKTALQNDAKSAADAAAVANLPSTYPVSGAPFVMSDAEAKALGLRPGNAPGVDGYVGFLNTAPYTFDPNNRAVAGEYDFIGLAEHEISEVMGRYGLGQNGASSGRYSPIDLFRYTSPGVLEFAPGSGGYFSINGGTTAINTFNGTGGGDLSDWAGATLDSYNAFLTRGAELDVSLGDLNEMDVIGYDAAVPEPPTLTLVGLATGALLLLRWMAPAAEPRDAR